MNVTRNIRDCSSPQQKIANAHQSIKQQPIDVINDRSKRGTYKSINLCYSTTLRISAEKLHEAIPDTCDVRSITKLTGVSAKKASAEFVRELKGHGSISSNAPYLIVSSLHAFPSESSQVLRAPRFSILGSSAYL